MPHLKTSKKIFFFLTVAILLSACANSFHQRKYKRGYNYGERKEVVVENSSKTSLSNTLPQERESDENIVSTSTTYDSPDLTENTDSHVNTEQASYRSPSEFEKELVEHLRESDTSYTQITAKKEPNEQKAMRFNKYANFFLGLFLGMLGLTILIAFLLGWYFLLAVILGIPALFIPTVFHSIFRGLNMKYAEEQVTRKKAKNWFWAVLIFYLALALAFILILVIIII